MAVATPVLERQSIQKQREMTADELHNAQIKENYKRLINPELNMRQVRGETAVSETEDAIFGGPNGILRRAAAPVQEQSAQPAYTNQAAARNIVYGQSAVSSRPVEKAEPYLVQNARADADIFRADSIINRRREAAPEIITDVIAPAAREEDEDEDLRPTRTTIQYKTVEEADHYKARTAAADSHQHVLGKRERIIIATFVSVVVALFILVIVNSAVIAGLNSELAAIESGVASARETLQNVTAQIDFATSAENIADYALSHGMYLL